MGVHIGGRTSTAPTGAWASDPCNSQSCPNLDVEKDKPIVTDLCHLHDQMARYRAALEEHGALLVEKIVSPRGEVVGNRLVASPASAQLKNAQAAAMAIYAALGLSPQARARLPR